MQNLTENVPNGVNSCVITEKGESLPSLPIPQSASKQMYVVEWALQSPNRHTQTNGELLLKEQITQKVCNYEHEARSSNEVAPIQTISKEGGFRCST